MSMWPKEFVVNDSDIQGIGVLPVIWIIGDKETGKSTFVATVDPVRPNHDTRTFVTDLEGSYTTIQTQAPLDIVNIRDVTFSRVGKDYTLKDLFVTWRDYVLGCKRGQYSVLGVDPVSDLFQGAFQWVGENSHLFGKKAQNYSGEMGTKAQWGDTSLYWKQLALELASRFETIVLVSHIKDTYKDNRRTGEKSARGADFTEIASLVLWLAKENNHRYAIVKKSRLSWWDWGDDERVRPILRDLLPRRLELEYEGQSYPELIASYMANPKADYGELNEVKNDPSIVIMSQTEENELKLQMSSTDLKLKIAEGRAKLMANLIEDGYYSSEKEVQRVAKANSISYDVARHDEVYAQLVELSPNKDSVETAKFEA